MKKIFFATLVAAVAFAGCAKNESLEIAQGRSISFRNASMTRATTAVTAGTFNVQAYKAAVGGPHTATVTFTDIYDLYSNRYTTVADRYYDGLNSYWFYCYAKANTGAVYVAGDGNEDGDTNVALTATSAATLTPGAIPSLAFTAADGLTDLVVATTGEVALANQSSQQALTFKHALSRVRFSAVNSTYEDDSDAPIAITSLTFSVAKDATNITNLATLAQTPGGSAKTYTLAGTMQDEVTDTAADVTTGKNVLYVVPQGLGEECITIIYTVGTGANKATLTKTFDLDTTTLEKGKSYNFVINFSLNRITFTAEVENWNSEDVIDWQ